MDERMTWRWIPELCSNDYEMSDIWFICVKVRQFQERTNIVNIYNWFLIVRIQFFHVRFNTLQYHSIMRRECKKKKNVENDTILLKVKIHRFQVMDGILTVHRYISVIIYRGRKKKKKKERAITLMHANQIHMQGKLRYSRYVRYSRKMSKLYSISWYTRRMNKYFSMNILFINLFLIIRLLYLMQ